MGQPNYLESTRVDREQFYPFLCQVFSIAKEQYQRNGKEIPSIITEWDEYTTQNTKKPSLQTIAKYFGKYTPTSKDSSDSDMGKILELIAERVESFTDTWEISNVRKTYIVVQMVTSTELEEPFTPVTGRNSTVQQEIPQLANKTHGTNQSNVYDLLADTEDETEAEDTEQLDTQESLGTSHSEATKDINAKEETKVTKEQVLEKLK